MAELSIAVVHRNQESAERAAKVFQAIGVKVRPMGFGCAMLGYRFDKILILYDFGLDVHEEPHKQEWLDRLKCRLSPDGEIVDLSF